MLVVNRALLFSLLMLTKIYYLQFILSTEKKIYTFNGGFKIDTAWQLPMVLVDFLLPVPFSNLQNKRPFLIDTEYNIT